ncbi:MAG: hypothetical protein ACOH18_03775 [Candidatus Saccharimonadaceae bacterium]
MGARISPGFTIIETVLFLSVTGLLVMGVLIGTGSALNAQRYRDAVESFKDLLQTQYSDLGSVRNSRSNTWSCGASAIPATGGTVIRGQSDCLLVGKYLRINATDITIFTVLARQSGTSSGSDITKLKNNYMYNVSTAEKETHSMDWGTQIAWPASGSGSVSPRIPRTIGILFIRSPDSGSIYTFSSNSISPDASINSATFTNMINAGITIPGQSERTICVLSSGLAPSGDTAIYLNPYAASASAVEVRSNDYLTSIGATTRC